MEGTVILPPSWLTQMDPEEFEERLSQCLAERLRNSRGELVGKFKITVRRGKKLTINVKSTDKKVIDDEETLDMEASTTIQPLVAREISEAFQDVLEDLSHGL
jgi:hypothetical protein